MLLLAAALFLAPAAAAVPRRPGAARGAPPRAGARAAPRAASEPASVWPMPQSMSLGTTPVALDASFAFSCAGAGCTAVVEAAFDQYTDILFFAGPPAPLGALPGVTGLALTVAADAPLALGVSENYTLALPAAGGVATAAADTPWGALRALETFAQLFSWAGNGVPTAYACASAPVAVTDFPRWQWRGVLLDSARHFLTPAAIRRAIDAMQATKLNTIHWHIVDDQAWPLVSTTLPLMSIAGAYAPEATYSHADISSIVDYAHARGIRLVPELDMPAHATVWGAGYPNFTISCADGQTLLNPVPEAGLYEAVDGLLGEFLPLFHSADFVHFGGDEVEDLTCWNESAAVQAFMASQGLPDVNAVRNYFESRVQSIAQKHGAASMFWEEVFDKDYTLLPSSVVDIWLSYDEVEAAVKAGHRIVSSFGLYLDQQVPFGDKHYFWADTWQNFYLADPAYNRTLSPAEASLILGGSISQWGEQADDANLESRMWPRAAGGAERLWSPAALRDVDAAEGRLEAWRCKVLQSRGVRAGPIRPSSVHGYCPQLRAA